MIGLAKFVEGHRRAVEYDLLRKTGHELSDVGDTLSWGALSSFVNNLEADSATSHEIEPETSAWATVAKTNAILADIYDILSAINANLIAVGRGERARIPDKYPRPENGKDKKKIFSSVMPADEMRAWFEGMRRKRCQG